MSSDPNSSLVELSHGDEEPVADVPHHVVLRDADLLQRHVASCRRPERHASHLIYTRKPTVMRGSVCLFGKVCLVANLDFYEYYKYLFNICIF